MIRKNKSKGRGDANFEEIEEANYVGVVDGGQEGELTL